MYFTIEMMGDKTLQVALDESVLEMLECAHLVDATRRFLGSGAAKKCLSETYEVFKAIMLGMVNALPEKDRNYAVNRGPYPMEHVFFADACATYMADVANEISKDTSFFEVKFNGLLTADVFNRWLRRLEKVAESILDTHSRKTLLYAEVVLKNIEKVSGDEDENLIDKIGEELEGALQCLYKEDDAISLAEDVNKIIYEYGYRINFGGGGSFRIYTK